ncbi:MAG: potassium transporter TrkG [Verrucomicrobiales bacterium]
MTTKDRSVVKPGDVNRLLWLQGVIGAVAIGLLVRELGWPLDESQALLSEYLTLSLVVLALIAEGGLVLRDPGQSKLKRNFILAALLMLAAGRFGLERPLRDWLGDQLHPRTGALIALVVVQLSLIIPVGLRLLRLTRARFLQQAKPGTLFVVSFLIVIIAGTLMLKTPNATTAGISWLDALFTSTSAVCVTGLIVVDTETAFTPQGQLAILVLIQIGGLGMMTLTYFMVLIVGQGITLRDRARLGELFSDENLGSMGQFVGKVVGITLLIELAGAIAIYYSWAAQPPRVGTLPWDAVFHSISAFCNAGFSTFAAGLADPATASNRPSQVAIMLLIILGGLGFVVVNDLPRLTLYLMSIPLKKFFPRSRRLARWHLTHPVRLQTRLALKTTALLLFAGALIFFFTERWNLSGERVWEAVFNSVTARTAGFNITNFGSYTFASIVLMCVLMFIGGSPGGTAGGIKTTTFAIALGELGRLIRGHNSLHIGNRRIARDVVDRSTATVVLSVLWVVVAILLVSWADPDLDAVDITFECFSAFGTVGLSRGITAALDPFSKWVIIVTMFAGRVGLLTLVLTMVGTPRPRRYELPDARLPLN